VVIPALTVGSLVLVRLLMTTSAPLSYVRLLMMKELVKKKSVHGIIYLGNAVLGGYFVVYLNHTPHKPVATQVNHLIDGI